MSKKVNPTKNTVKSTQNLHSKDGGHLTASNNAASASQKILVILGPTASGKSDLAVEIAKCIEAAYSKSSKALPAGRQAEAKSYVGGEIISADSRQVYKGLNLGSGKITKKEMRGVPHHLLDVASPKKTFTVTQFQKLGKQAIKKTLAKNKLPIICGGTGLYIDSLIYGNQFPEVPPQPKLREKLENIPTEKLFEKLQKLDPNRSENIDRHNRRRLIRALEIVLTTGKPVPQINGSIDRTAVFDALIIGIKKSNDKLKKLVKKRLDKRLKIGMIKEVMNLHKQGVTWKRLNDLGLEYRFISRYLRQIEKIGKNKNISINQSRNQSKTAFKEMKESIIKESLKYAKRQMTWFKRNKDIKWIASKSEATKLVKKFLKV